MRGQGSAYPVRRDAVHNHQFGRQPHTASEGERQIQDRECHRVPGLGGERTYDACEERARNEHPQPAEAVRQDTSEEGHKKRQWPRG